MIDLSGRTALVTGGARGIGLAVARVLSAAGARIAINDLDATIASDTAATLGRDSFGIGGDVSHAHQARAIVEATVSQAGRLDILVNNAGIAPELLPIAEQRAEDWQRVLDVNLRSAFLMSQAAAAAMHDGRGAAIVHIASIAGLVGFPASHAYGVSKAGLIMLAKTLATELARRGIRVNAVAPGVVDAPMLAAMSRRPGDMDVILARVPLGRLGTPEDIGRAVAFLSSDAASYITGAVLPVDGGWQAFGGAGPASR